MSSAAQEFPEPDHHPVKRQQPRSRRRMLWSKFWRIAVGSVLIVAGVFMLVLPGPGIATIIAGLAVMASEVPPAERAMNYMKKRFHQAVARARGN